MAEAYKKVKYEINLYMDEKEATWLEALLQNPILSDDQKPEDENEDEYNTRKKLFEALKNELNR